MLSVTSGLAKIWLVLSIVDNLKTDEGCLCCGEV